MTDIQAHKKYIKKTNKQTLLLECMCVFYDNKKVKREKVFSSHHHALYLFFWLTLVLISPVFILVEKKG